MVRIAGSPTRHPFCPREQAAECHVEVHIIQALLIKKEQQSSSEAKACAPKRAECKESCTIGCYVGSLILSTVELSPDRVCNVVISIQHAYSDGLVVVTGPNYKINYKKIASLASPGDSSDWSALNQVATGGNYMFVRTCNGPRAGRQKKKCMTTICS